MKSIKEVRRENLLTLRDDMFGGVQAEMAAALRKQPNVISRALNIDGANFRPIGEAFSREIEKKLGLERHWMDQDHHSNRNQVGSNIHKLVSSQSEPIKPSLQPEIVSWALKTMETLVGEEVRAREGEEWWAITFVYLYDLAVSDRQVMQLSNTALLRMVNK